MQVRYRKSNIVTTKRVRRLEWAGHVVRTCDNTTAREVFLGKQCGRRRAGRRN